MPTRTPLIGLVGKPSSGKSTTLNSLTDASSKVGKWIQSRRERKADLGKVIFRKSQTLEGDARIQKL